METILNALLPQLLEIVALTLAAVLTWAAAKAKAKFGIDIEARHRDALHSAIMTGVRLALANGMSGGAAVTAALDHARLSVPDAITALGAGKTVLINIAEAKMQEAAGDALTAALRKAGAS
ncbi:hypothetical protein [Paracoccus yeei]|uniref:Uncharacterized protein n=1 Tax=Paracoccus yeei TaxID=147645 RepID=A0A5P2QQD6_9RHOB|nr:hypothetical protein [Paracoccus yeei]QEU08244.1 hypothetical protein FOB51_09640 [Paracoccus yeei]